MDNWTEKLDLYLDGELSAAEMHELDAHLRTCPSCTADVLVHLQRKRAVQSAGKRYTASPEFRGRILKKIATRPRRSGWRVWGLASASIAVLAVAVFMVISTEQRLVRQQMFSEIVDLHVATLASANPVDVISSDRHTVKPWFQGRIPFAFNLPELQNSDFSLVGGRVCYLGQAPGAELIYQIRKHQFSVFIFQDRAIELGPNSDSGIQRQHTFNLQTWSQGNLRYWVIGDAGGDDIRNLAELLKKAAGS